MTMPGRTVTLSAGNGSTAGSSYRYGFNGKEKDNSTAEGSYDFGARILDTRLGRWLSMDPLAAKYTDLSPYNFVANTPLVAIDPDGKLIIFVNGFRSGAYIDGLIDKIKCEANPFNLRCPDMEKPWEKRGGAYSGTDKYGGEGKSYWGDIDDMFMNKTKDEKAIYTDGGFEPTSKAEERYSRGLADGRTIIRAIKNGDIQLQKDANGNITESIKIVGHSHGGWHAAGIADAMEEAAQQLGLKGLKVEVLYLINPHQPNGDAEILGNYRSVQYSRPSDLLSSGIEYNSLGKNPFKWEKNASKNGARYILRRILKLFGNSKMARMKGVDEKSDLKNIRAIKRLDGHFVEDAKEIGDIKSGSEGAIEKRKDNLNP